LTTWSRCRCRSTSRSPASSAGSRSPRDATPSSSAPSPIRTTPPAQLPCHRHSPPAGSPTPRTTSRARLLPPAPTTAPSSCPGSPVTSPCARRATRYAYGRGGGVLQLSVDLRARRVLAARIGANARDDIRAATDREGVRIGVVLNGGRGGTSSPRRGKSPKLKQRRHRLILRVDSVSDGGEGAAIR
jgi:hypothetical protein